MAHLNLIKEGHAVQRPCSRAAESEIYFSVTMIVLWCFFGSGSAPDGLFRRIADEHTLPQQAVHWYNLSTYPAAVPSIMHYKNIMESQSECLGRNLMFMVGIKLKHSIK